MPVKALRSSTGLRPGLRKRRGLGAGNSGLMTSHNLSVTSGLAIATSSDTRVVYNADTQMPRQSFILLVSLKRKRGFRKGPGGIEEKA